MGADIWTYVEHYNHKTKKWENANLYEKTPGGNFDMVNFYTGRNYTLFGKLAGVRGMDEPMVYPRGLPEDISPEVKEEYAKFEGYAHSATWYDLYELRLLVDAGRGKVKDEVWNEETDQYELREVDYVKGFLEDAEHVLHMSWHWLAEKVGENRIIMWFDS